MLCAGKEGGRATGNSNEVETEIKRGRTRGPSGVGGLGVKTETHRQRTENGEKRSCGEREYPRGVCRIRGLDHHHRELSKQEARE